MNEEDFVVIKEAETNVQSSTCDFCDSMCSDCDVLGSDGCGNDCTCYKD